jgi:hypothetical protein
VLDEAARRGLIELPDDWTIAGDQNEMVSQAEGSRGDRGEQLTRA